MEMCRVKVRINAMKFKSNRCGMEMKTPPNSLISPGFKSNRCGMEMIAIELIEHDPDSNRTVAEWKYLHLADPHSADLIQIEPLRNGNAFSDPHHADLHHSNRTVAEWKFPCKDLLITGKLDSNRTVAEWKSVLTASFNNASNSNRTVAEWK